MDAKHLPRFTEWKDYKALTNGVTTKPSNGTKPSPKESPNIASPSTPGLANSNGTRGRVGERGRDGTVRFMLNPEREQEENAVVAEYFKPDEEEEEIEVEVDRKR
jgi:CTD kinase subunit beta